MRDKPKYSAPASKKTLDIIELMVRNNRSYNVTEIATLTNSSVNSVFRIMIELEQKKYVIKNDTDYELTSKLYFLGSSLQNRISLIAETRPTLNKIRNLTQETILLTQLNSENRTFVLDQLPSPLPIKFLSTVGVAYDSYCSAMGKCLLAFSSDNIMDSYLENTVLTAHTKTTITDKSVLRAELLKIREDNIAYDNEESVAGLTCIACPILSSNNNLVGAIGISAISFRITPMILKEFSTILKDNCNALSNQLGNV